MEYIFWKIHFDLFMPKYKKVIGISTKLANHFSDIGCYFDIALIIQHIPNDHEIPIHHSIY